MKIKFKNQGTHKRGFGSSSSSIYLNIFHFITLPSPSSLLNSVKLSALLILKTFTATLSLGHHPLLVYNLIKPYLWLYFNLSQVSLLISEPEPSRL